MNCVEAHASVQV